MTSPVNIYEISRIRDTKAFNIVAGHQAQTGRTRTQYHEIESLRIVADAFVRAGFGVADCDGFFFGFSIPHIGKEFDLLKFTGERCLNIELKSQPIPKRQILAQLLKNRYYLMHLGKELHLFTVVTDTFSCYKLTADERLEEIDFFEIASVSRLFSMSYINSIDALFKASEYLISPLDTPEKFIQGEYFLTQAQEKIKREVLDGIAKARNHAYFHITGNPGTGKTLLLYDLAKTLSATAPTLIIQCGRLLKGQKRIRKAIGGLNVVSVRRLGGTRGFAATARFIFVDESHRMNRRQFESLCATVAAHGSVCIFSSDPEQVLSREERENDIAGEIRRLPLGGEFVLSEKLRMNRELSTFILRLKNIRHRPRQRESFSHVSLSFANTLLEAQNLIAYYKAKGFVFINYTRSKWNPCPFDAFKEDFDTHHVIGQEFDKVVMLMDNSFYYDENGVLQGIPHPSPDYLYPNMFYQGITRAREDLALVIVDAPELFGHIASILEEIRN